MSARLARSLLGTLVAGAVALATGACFATRGDVRVLQQDLLAARSEAARADSARAAQLNAIIASLDAVNDSLRVSAARLSRWQATTTEDIRAVREQILVVQELTGQSQQRLLEFRAQLEERNEQVAVPPTATTTPTSGTAPAAGDSAAAAPQPGPNQLYQLGYDQLRRGSTSAARAGFEDLLRQYPTSDLAPDAMFYVAETYAAERNEPAADSTYMQVVARWPRSPRAATALYKHATILQRAGRNSEARQAYERVVREYPRSDEAELARESLRTLR